MLFWSLNFLKHYIFSLRIVSIIFNLLILFNEYFIIPPISILTAIIDIIIASIGKYNLAQHLMKILNILNKIILILK